MQAGGTEPWQHRTVLLHEAVESLVTTADGVYLDGTFGRGGHSRLILSRLSPRGRLLAIDRDPEAVAHARSGSQAIADPRFSIAHTSFAHLADAVRAQGVSHVDGVLLDIGVSSPQIDNPERGFSFRFNGPLDMRMDPTRGESAAEFLLRADEREIAEVIREYGEERFAGPIAKALVARRAGGQPVATTAELSDVVARAVKTREPGQDPATRTFQALRIHVNAELAELEQGLSAALELLAPQGRLAVISFHSLEDRIVKTFIARHSKREVDRRSPAYLVQPEVPPLLHAVARIKPSESEVRANPRARSAILRVAERTDAPYVAEPEVAAPARGKKPARRAGGRA
ncbi:16S rRNA (cytosine(1402)-N(4))-methyltransferase RsmH [Aquabacterium sp.]|uniref:16S rRNA (cytosine(1402)-N(4))-methyltransferase RsmH n=1 Tax=Aquabacterium sp. TaxID=1872578 RepID=UPI0035B21F83